MAVAFGLAWVLLFGPFFPWSPWKPGYQHLWIQARGRDAFQRLLLAAMEAPGEYVGLFEQVYGLSLETAAADFTAALRTRRWVPKP